MKTKSHLSLTEKRHVLESYFVNLQNREERREQGENLDADLLKLATAEKLILTLDRAKRSLYGDPHRTIKNILEERPALLAEVVKILERNQNRIVDAKKSPWDRAVEKLPVSEDTDFIEKFTQDQTRQVLADLYDHVTEGWNWVEIYNAEDSRYTAAQKYLVEAQKQGREKYGERYDWDIQELKDFIIGIEHSAERRVCFTIGRTIGR